MSGDWIPYTKCLPKKPEVLQIAAATGKSPREVVSILLEFWSWVDDHSVSGFCPLPIGQMSRIVADTDGTFWQSLADVGWITISEGGVTVSNFTFWMGKSSKKRLQEARRKQSNRCNQNENQDQADKCPPPSGQMSATKQDKNVATEQKSIEENKTRKKNPPTPQGGGAGPSPAELRDAWNGIEHFSKIQHWTTARDRALQARRKSPFWVEHWREALSIAAARPFCRGENDRGWVADVDWFLRDGTVTKLLEGKYQGGSSQPRGGETIAEKIDRLNQEGVGNG